MPKSNTIQSALLESVYYRLLSFNSGQHQMTIKAYGSLVISLIVTQSFFLFFHEKGSKIASINKNGVCGSKHIPLLSKHMLTRSYKVGKLIELKKSSFIYGQVRSYQR